MTKSHFVNEKQRINSRWDYVIVANGFNKSKRSVRRLDSLDSLPRLHVLFSYFLHVTTDGVQALQLASDWTNSTRERVFT